MGLVRSLGLLLILGGLPAVSPQQPFPTPPPQPRPTPQPTVTPTTSPQPTVTPTTSDVTMMVTITLNVPNLAAVSQDNLDSVLEGHLGGVRPRFIGYTATLLGGFSVSHFRLTASLATLDSLGYGDANGWQAALESDLDSYVMKATGGFKPALSSLCSCTVGVQSLAVEPLRRYATIEPTFPPTTVPSSLPTPEPTEPPTSQPTFSPTMDGTVTMLVTLAFHAVSADSVQESIVYGAISQLDVLGGIDPLNSTEFGYTSGYEVLIHPGNYRVARFKAVAVFAAGGQGPATFGSKTYYTADEFKDDLTEEMEAAIENGQFDSELQSLCTCAISTLSVAVAPYRPYPTLIPTPVPTSTPNRKPTGRPTLPPTDAPSFVPSPKPSWTPTHLPTRQPTPDPTLPPTAQPVPFPTKAPTPLPTPEPSICENCTNATDFNCTRGWYSSPAGCRECQAGRYTPKHGYSSCLKCSAGLYQPAKAAVECTAQCAAGKFSSEGASECDLCGRGKYQGSTGQTTCTECTAGTAQPDLGQTNCTDCDGGEFAAGTGATACSTCGAGQFSASGAPAPACGDCDAGKYQASTGQSECTSCDGGKYQASTGATTCTDECTAGEYSGSGAVACTACPVGTAAPGAGQAEVAGTKCPECVKGTFQASTGETACTLCTAGKYQSAFGATSCTSECPLGKYSPEGAFECTYCVPGSVAPGPASGSCANCTAGKYQPYQGQEACFECAAGKFMALTGRAACDDCEPGYFEGSTGSALCDSSCAKGQFSRGGAATCTSCAKGQYQNRTARASCHPAPAGFYIPEVGSTGRTNRTRAQTSGFYEVTSEADMFPCEPGLFSEGAAEACSMCATGRFSQGQSTNCKQCAVGSYQNLPGQQACVRCAPGLLSDASRTSCKACAPGEFVRNTSACAACPIGHYAPSAQKGACLVCPEGFHTAANITFDPVLGDAGRWVGATTCTACEPGTYSLAESINCKTCTRGQFSVNAARYCVDCEKGRFSAGDGAGACDSCAAGKVAKSMGRISCEDCPLGQSQGATGQANCTDCGVGKIAATMGRTDCSDCGSGEYNPGFGKSACLDCAAGKFSAEGASECTACPLGFFAAESKTAECIACESGKFANVTESTACTVCPVGQSQGATGQFGCIDCAPGTIAPLNTSTSCVACAAGRFQDVEGETACVACAVGKLSAEGAAACGLCETGKFTNELESTVCGACVPGQFVPTEGASACLDCPPGTYSSEGAYKCENCSKGFSNPDFGQSSCAACEGGKYQDIMGSAKCDECSAGKAQGATGQPLCVDCDVGKFAASTGLTACAVCVAGQFKNSLGASACDDCAAGKFSPVGALACTVCDTGRMSLNGSSSCDACLPGKFALSQGLGKCTDCALGQFSAEGATQCSSCDFGKIAATTGQEVCASCLAGRNAANQGMSSCTVCAPGQFSAEASKNCQDCLPGYIAPVQGTSDCAACAAGTFARLGGGTACTMCPMGQSQGGTGQQGCTDCAVGTFAALNGSSACQSCGGGTIQPGTGSTNCLKCSPGQYQSATGGYECFECAAGTFAAKPGASFCPYCPGSTYARAGSTVCDHCVKNYFLGLYAPYAGQCLKCPVGTTCAENGGSDQVNLEVDDGYWRITPTAITVSECTLPSACKRNTPPEGSVSRRLLSLFSPSERAQEEASFQVEPKEEPQVEDLQVEGPLVEVAPVVVRRDRKLLYSSEHKCNPGYTGPLCALCDTETGLGYYLNPDTKECVACQAESAKSLMDLVMGSIILKIIFFGACAFFAVQISLVALAKYREHHGMIEEGPTWEDEPYASIKRIAELENDSVTENRDGSLTFVKRTVVMSKPKMTVTSVKTTTPVSEIKTITTATETPGKQTILRRTTLKHSSRWQALMHFVQTNKVKVKIFTAFFQIATNIAFNCALSFPDNFSNMVESFAILNIDIVPSLGLNCRFRAFDYIDQMIVQTVGPILIACFLLLLYLVFGGKKRTAKSDRELEELYAVPEELEEYFSTEEARHFRRTFFFFDKDGSNQIDMEEMANAIRECHNDATEEEVQALNRELFYEAGLKTMDGEDVFEFEHFLESMHEARHLQKTSSFSILVGKAEILLTDRVGQAIFSNFLVLTFLVLCGTSATLFHYFKCHSFQESDRPGGQERYLYKDYSVDCDGARYQTYILYAWCMILVYPVGIPALYATVIVQNREVLGDNEARLREMTNDYPTIGHLRFLVESYKTKYYWFEVAECGRRLLLASAIGIFDSDSPASPAVGFLFTLIFSWAFVQYRPYKIEGDSSLAVVLAYSLSLLFLAGLLIKVDIVGDSPEDQELFGNVLMIILFLGPVGTVSQLAADNLPGLYAQYTKKPAKYKLLEEDKKANPEKYEEGHTMNALIEAADEVKKESGEQGDGLRKRESKGTRDHLASLDRYEEESKMAEESKHGQDI